MKKIIFIFFIVGIVFSGCKNPHAPDLEEVVGEVVNPTAQILLIGGVMKLEYSEYLEYGTLTHSIRLWERGGQGVSAKVQLASVRVKFRNDEFYIDDFYEDHREGHIDIGTGDVLGDGELKIFYRVHLPSNPTPTTILFRICLVDEYGHEMCVEESRLWSD